MNPLVAGVRARAAQRFDRDTERAYMASVEAGIGGRIRLLGVTIAIYAPLYLAIGEMQGRPRWGPAPLLCAAAVEVSAVALIVVTFLRLQPRARQRLFATVGIAFGGTVIGTVLTSASEPEPYPYAGLLLVVLAVHLATGIDLLRTTAVAVAVSIGYVVLAAATVDRPHLALEITLLFVANGIGFVCAALLETQTRRSFMLRRHLVELAASDPLTGLRNRRAFDAQFDLLWRRAAREGVRLGLAMVDMDHLKRLNDAKGHAAGDWCLRTLAEQLSQTLRHPLDVAARLGGDEFAVCWYDVRDHEMAELLGRLQRHVADTGTCAGTGGWAFSVSVGAVQAVPIWPRTPATFVESADRKLYAAKAAGRQGTAVAAAFA